MVTPMPRSRREIDLEHRVKDLERHIYDLEHWYIVSEKRPPEREAVLLCDKDLESGTIGICIGFQIDGIYISFSGSRILPTHWKPLPNGPE